MDKRFQLPRTDPCPVGWVTAMVEQDNGEYELRWVDPMAIETPLTQKYSTLTVEQKERVRKVRWQLREHDKQTFKQWVINFEQDVTPERELRVMEAIARTYMAETSLKHHSKRERHCLYWAIMFASMLGSAKAVVSSRPEFKNMRNLEGIVERYRQYISETWTAEDEARATLAREAKMKQETAEASNPFANRQAFADDGNHKHDGTRMN